MTDSRRDLGDRVHVRRYLGWDIHAEIPDFGIRPRNLLTLTFDDGEVHRKFNIPEGAARALLAFLRECGWPKEAM